MARRALGLAAVLTFVLALNNFAVPAILQVKVFPAEVWVRFNTNLDSVAALESSWPLISRAVVTDRFIRSGAHRLAKRWRIRPRLRFPPATERRLVLFRWRDDVLASLLSVGLPLTQLLATPTTCPNFIPRSTRA